MRHNGNMLAALVALSIGAVQLSAQAPELKWGPAPPVFPTGAKMAVLQGDPGKAEQFTVRFDFPAGYTIAPHFHPTDEHITVITGTFIAYPWYRAAPPDRWSVRARSGSGHCRCRARAGKCPYPRR